MTGIIDQAAQVLSSSNVDRGFVSDIISPKLYTSISKAKQKKKDIDLTNGVQHLLQLESLNLLH